MKHLLLSAGSIVALGAAGTREETLEYRVEEGTEITRTFEARAEYELEEVVFYADGEIVNELSDVDMTIDSLERIVVRDELVEVEDGRPTDLRRTFLELVQEDTQSNGEDELESVSGSDLEGLTVRFLWDDDDEAYYAEADDEDHVDEEVLEGLIGGLDLLDFLPDGEVEEGDEWELEASTYLSLMWPSGLLGFYDENASGADPVSTHLNQQIIENLDGEGVASFEGVRDEDGERLAVISVSLAIDTYAEAEREIEEHDVTYDVEIEIDREIEGELLWDLERGVLYSASFEADAEMVRTTSSVAELEDQDGNTQEVDLEREDTYGGTVTYEVDFEVE